MMLVCFSLFDIPVSILSFITADEDRAIGEMTMWYNPIMVNILTIIMMELFIILLLSIYKPL